MTRKGFFAMFLGAAGAAKAQEAIGPAHGADFSQARIIGNRSGTLAFKNGQCPVCGVVAPPYKADVSLGMPGMGETGYKVIKIDPTKFVACKNCRNVFEMDAAE